MRKKREITVVKKPKSLFGIIFGSFSILCTLGLSVFMALGAAGQVKITKETCTVIYNDYHGKVLYQTEVKEGEDSKYPYPAPTIPPDGDRSYIFQGWFPSDKNIQENPTICFPLYIPSDLDLSELADTLFDQLDFENLDKIPPDILDKLGLDNIDINQFLTMPLFTINTPKTGTIYLRQDSYADYVYKDGKGIYQHAPKYPLDVDATEMKEIRNPLNYTSELAGKSFSNFPITFDYKLKRKEFNCPAPLYTTTDTNFIYSNNDSYQLNSSVPKHYESDYCDISYSTDHVRTLSDNIDTLTSAQLKERAYYNEFVKNSYTSLNLKSELTQKLNDIIEKKELSKEKGSVLQDVADAVRSICRTNTSPGLYPNSEDPINDMLTPGNFQGNQNHFAGLTNYLFRQLGIPSRIVDGFAILNHKKDEPVDVTIGRMHRWCEAYLDNIGWIAVDTFYGLDGEEPDRNKGDLKIAIEGLNDGEYLKKEYDGSPMNIKFNTNGVRLGRDEVIRTDNKILNESFQVCMHDLMVNFYVYDKFLKEDVSESYNFNGKTRVAFMISPRTVTIKTYPITVSLNRDNTSGIKYIEDLTDEDRKWDFKEKDPLPTNDEKNYLHRIEDIKFSIVPNQEGVYKNAITDFKIIKYEFERQGENDKPILKNPVDVTSSFYVLTDFADITVVRD